jgi:hypothetical protein
MPVEATVGEVMSENWRVAREINAWCGAGGTLQELAELVGVDREYLSDLKAERRTLDPEISGKFWKVLNDRPAWTRLRDKLRSKKTSRIRRFGRRLFNMSPFKRTS